MLINSVSSIKNKKIKIIQMRIKYAYVKAGVVRLTLINEKSRLKFFNFKEELSFLQLLQFWNWILQFLNVSYGGVVPFVINNHLLFEIRQHRITKLFLFFWDDFIFLIPLNFESLCFYTFIRNDYVRIKLMYLTVIFIFNN